MHCKCTIKLAPGANGMLSCNLEILTLLSLLLHSCRQYWWTSEVYETVCVPLKRCAFSLSLLISFVEILGVTTLLPLRLWTSCCLTWGTTSSIWCLLVTRCVFFFASVFVDYICHDIIGIREILLPLRLWTSCCLTWDLRDLWCVRCVLLICQNMWTRMFEWYCRYCRSPQLLIFTNMCTRIFEW